MPDTTPADELRTAAKAHESARIRIINHPGVADAADTEIAALLDEYQAEITARIASDLCAFGFGEAAAFLNTTNEDEDLFITEDVEIQAVRGALASLRAANREKGRP